MRDFFKPGRSPVSGLASAVSSSHALASAAALLVLSEGGNAVDAAVAASFVLCVVEPQSTGIGGDCFALYFAGSSERPVGLNGSGRTPAALDVERARSEGGTPLREASVHSVTIPGMVDGLARLLGRFGSWPLARVLEPAISYAANGFPVYQRTAEEWSFVTGKLAGTATAREGLLRQGKAPAAGDVVTLPALAGTLRLIADRGPDAFYRGRLAELMAGFLRSHGGCHTAGDFASHRSEEMVPISIPYRGHDVWQIPPNGQGAAALMMLNLLEETNAAGDEFDGAMRHLRLADAARVAFRERDRLIADPQLADIRLDGFLDKAEALRTAAAMSGGGSDLDLHAASRGDTAYVCVVDKDRNAVSLISSLFEGFGSGLYEPETGVVFHNRGSGFSARPDHPNALAPAKRPLHTIIPGMVSRAGRPVLAFGVTGGQFQPIGHVQLVSGMLDYGLDIQDVIDRPRSFLINDQLQLEPGLMQHAETLAAAGYDVVPAPRAVGGAHGVFIDWERGSLTGGSDARKDGCALAL